MDHEIPKEEQGRQGRVVNLHDHSMTHLARTFFFPREFLWGGGGVVIGKGEGRLIL
jgi:hypothetical protein